MKAVTSLITYFFLLVSFSLFAQETTWIDANWNETTQEKAVFYRKVVQIKNGYTIKDFYSNGKIYREGNSETTVLKRESFFGKVTYYFKNGKIFKKENYENGRLEGRFYEYYETGEPYKTGAYEDNLKEGVWKTYYRNGKIKEKGKYHKGDKEGVWKTYYKNS